MGFSPAGLRRRMVNPIGIELRMPIATAGTITGKISFTGKKPVAKKIDVDEDQQCAHMHQKAPLYDQSVVVNKNGTLANVFVYVKEGLEGKTYVVEDGVCALFIAEKLGISPPTCGEHLKLLSRAGLIRGRKIKQWVFYRRDEDRIAQVKETLAGDW